MAWIGRSGQMDSDGDMPGYAGIAAPAAFIACDDRATALIAGPAGTMAQLSGWAERAGLRCIGAVELDDIANRLAMTVAVDLILVDMRGCEPDGASARALVHRRGLPDTELAILSDLAGIDRAFALFDGPGTNILCDPTSSDIVSLLVMTALDAERRRCDPQLHDSKRQDESSRFEQLSDEVRRLAATIDRLTRPGEGQPEDNGIDGATPYRGLALSGEERIEDRQPSRNGSLAGAPSHGEIRALLRARRLREQYLPADLFADPAWDMILDLMAARLAGQRVSVSSLCIAAAVPPTTALRWIRQLTERGVFLRIDDPADGRRVFIELTDGAAEAVMAWSHAVRRNGGLLPPA